METRAIATLCFCLLFFTFLARECSSKRFENPEDMKQCKKESRRTLKSIVKDFGVCNAEMKKKVKDMKEHSRKMGCVVRCVLDTQQIIEKNGLVTNETLMIAIGNRTTLAKPFVIESFQNCKTKIGDFLDPKDERCAKYAEFGQCIQAAVADMCDSPVPV